MVTTVQKQSSFISVLCPAMAPFRSWKETKNVINTTKEKIIAFIKQIFALIKSLLSNILKNKKKIQEAVPQQKSKKTTASQSIDQTAFPKTSIAEASTTLEQLSETIAQDASIQTHQYTSVHISTDMSKIGTAIKTVKPFPQNVTTSSLKDNLLTGKLTEYLSQEDPPKRLEPLTKDRARKKGSKLPTSYKKRLKLKGLKARQDNLSYFSV